MTNQEPQQLLPVPTELQILECEKVLGVGISYDIPHLLSCYELKLWAMEENKEWSPELFDKFTHAKFVLLRQLILGQIENNGRFQVTSPFDNTCNKCGGTGEIFKFLRKSQWVDCMKCVKGITPEGSKCLTCKGKGKLKTFGIVATLRDTTTCSFCKGRGYFKKQQVNNPAIDDQTAKELKKKLSATVVEKQPATNLGAEVKAAVVDSAIIDVDQVAPNLIDENQDEAIGEGATQKIKQPPAD